MKGKHYLIAIFLIGLFSISTNLKAQKIIPPPVTYLTPEQYFADGVQKGYNYSSNSSTSSNLSVFQNSIALAMSLGLTDYANGLMIGRNKAISENLGVIHKNIVNYQSTIINNVTTYSFMLEDTTTGILSYWEVEFTTSVY